MQEVRLRRCHQWGVERSKASSKLNTAHAPSRDGIGIETANDDASQAALGRAGGQQGGALAPIKVIHLSCAATAMS